MQKQKLYHKKQLKVLKIAKAFVILVLGLSFALEFVLLNFIADNREKILVITSYKQLGSELVAVKDTVTTQINDELQKLVHFSKTQQEKNKNNKTENPTFPPLNLFIENSSLYFNFCNYSNDEIQKLQIFYQMFYTKTTLADIFHPPQA
jgi:hypothetical protein